MPTIYQDIRNRTILTNQYSVTEHFKQSDVPTGHQLPGVFFFYDLSPIKARSRPHACQISTSALVRWGHGRHAGGISEQCGVDGWLMAGCAAWRGP